MTPCTVHRSVLARLRQLFCAKSSYASVPHGPVALLFLPGTLSTTTNIRRRRQRSVAQNGSCIAGFGKGVLFTSAEYSQTFDPALSAPHGAMLPGRDQPLPAFEAHGWRKG